MPGAQRVRLSVAQAVYSFKCVRCVTQAAIRRHNCTERSMQRSTKFCVHASVLQPLAKRLTRTGKMFSDKELRRSGNQLGIEGKALLTNAPELQPEGLTKAYKWFDTASKLYPRGSRATIPRRLRKWKHKVIGWEVVATEAALQALRAGRRRGNLRDAEENFVEASASHDSSVRLRESLKQACREYRAKQRKKRTCSHCGTTAPFSSRAFPYCGGCRHSDVARKDRPRYCSEECQRAHWLAGHMNECPCTG